jgi:large subunit ribosomal protein L22
MEAVAKLNKSSISPRKMRLVADLIRGARADKAFAILKNEPKKCAIYLEKLLLSAVANWQVKNKDLNLEQTDLYVKTIQVDSAGMLKRLRPAPQGRGHRIRKRFNHVTLVVDAIQEFDFEIDSLDGNEVEQFQPNKQE